MSPTLTKRLILDRATGYDKTSVPAQVSNLKLWLDASITSSITDSAGAVSQVNDLSSNADHTHNATQGTGAAQPITNASTKNSLNIIDFDGSDDYLASNDVVSYITGEDIPHSFHVVYTTNNPVQNFQSIFSFGRSTTTTPRIALSIAGDGRIIYQRTNDATTVTNVVAVTATDANFHAVSVCHDGSNLVIYYDGVEVINQADSYGDTTVDQLAVGALNRTTVNNELDGSVGEVLYYDRYNSPLEALKIQEYLIDKWAVFKPTDISGCSLWLDASNTTTASITESSGSISQWTDLSGNGNDAIQGTGAEQPTIQATISNNRSAVLFDGADDRLDIASAASHNNVFDTGGFILAAISPSSDGEASAGRIFSKNGSDTNMYTSSEAGGFCKLWFDKTFSGSDGKWATDSLDLVIGQMNIVGVYYDASSVSNDPVIYINSKTAVSVTESTTPVGTVDDDSGTMVVGNSGGGDRSYDGYIGELVIFKNKNPSASEISDLFDYLSDKYGVTLGA